MTEASLKPLLSVTSKELQRFEKNQHYLSRPRLMGLYDIDYDKFAPSKQIRTHFKEPILGAYPLNLNEMNDSFVALMYETQNSLLRPLFHAFFNRAAAMNNNNDAIPPNDGVERTDVYTRRCMLEKIMEFCYGKFNFDAIASRYSGKLYLIPQPQKREEFEREEGSTHHVRLCQLVFVDDDGHQTSNDDNVFQVSMYKSTLGKYNINYMGRIQGVMVDGESKNVTDLNDLNKMRFISAKQMWCTLKNNDQKLLKFWLQAYLSNVNELYLAYKEPDGTVREPIKCLKVCDIPKKCFWKPGICTTFLNEFLEKIEQLMSNIDSLDTVFKFHFNARNKTIYYEKYEGKSEMSFLRNQFMDVYP